MQSSSFPRKLIILFTGDAVTFALVTLVGLATHDELDQGVARFFPNFLPLWAGWLLLAPFLDVYRLDKAADFTSLWRPFWAMVLAAPFGLLLRSLWLGTAVIPIFVLVMGGISALAILAWRLIYWIFARHPVTAQAALESTERNG